MKIVETIFPVMCVFSAILLMAFFGYKATERSLTELEAYGFQAFCLVIGLFGSYVFGRRISKDAVKEIVEQQARPALRRLVTLYRSISRVAQTIEGQGDDRLKIALIQAIVTEQIDAAGDALEDWRDLVPESLEDLRQEASSNGR